MSFLLACSLALMSCATKQHGHDDYDARLIELRQRIDRLAAAPAQQVVVQETTKRASRASQVPEGYTATSMALPSGDESTSTVLVEKMVPVKVVAGSEYTSYIVVTNVAENVALRDVTVRDSFSNGYALKSATPAASTATATGAVWNLGTLAPGDTARITLVGSSDQTGAIESCAVVDYTPYLCISTLAEQPELTLALTGTANAQLCDELTFSTTVRNAGTGTARDVKVTVRLSEGVTTADGQSVATFDVPSLAAGQSRDFSFKGKASRTGTFLTQAIATAADGLTARSSDVNTVICKPVLRVTVSGIESTFAGRRITFNGTVTNAGDCASANTVVTMSVPSCTKFVSASSGGTATGSVVTWNLGTLEAGATSSVSLVLQADEICVATTEIAAAGACADRVTAGAATELVGIPAILLEVVDVDDPIEVGGIEEFIITVTNQGTATDTGIRMVVELENMEYVSSTGPTTSSALGNRVTFAPLPTLEAKQVVEWRLRTRAAKAGDIRTRFTLTTDRLDRPVEETEATFIYE
ncbi:MAG: DUF11 domain-containing protein [Candidatus Sumerlaeia bacterium]|nr:DUF11 domain-containing protein [Candidatus Sumerlaeia bacterium]